MEIETIKPFDIIAYRTRNACTRMIIIVLEIKNYPLSNMARIRGYSLNKKHKPKIQYIWWEEPYKLLWRKLC